MKTEVKLNGTMLVIDVDGSEVSTKFEGRTPTLEEMQAAVDGYIEAVPYFTKIVVGDEIVTCMAFCDEEGKIKNKPANVKAQRLWEAAFGRLITEDHLVGSILIVYGTREWIESL